MWTPLGSVLVPPQWESTIALNIRCQRMPTTRIANHRSRSRCCLNTGVFCTSISRKQWRSNHWDRHSTAGTNTWERAFKFDLLVQEIFQKKKSVSYTILFYTVFFRTVLNYYIPEKPTHTKMTWKTNSHKDDENNNAENKYRWLVEDKYKTGTGEVLRLGQQTKIKTKIASNISHGPHGCTAGRKR